MNKQTQAISHDISRLTQDAHALVNATADIASEKVGEARARLAAALDHGREFYDRVRDKALQGGRAADEVLCEHSYQAVGIAIGVGAVLGYLLARRCAGTRNRD